MTIEALNAKIKGLEIELSMLKAQRHDLLNNQFGISVGGFVSFQGKIFKVASVSHKSQGKPWIRGYLLKKDGSISCVPRDLFSQWEKTDAPEGH